LRKEAELLLPYYVETRYPFGDDETLFDESKAEEALRAASRIIDLVEKKF